MITSSANTKVKQITNLLKKPKARKEQGVFVVEGLKMFLELPKEKIEAVFVSQSFILNKKNQEILYDLSYEVLSDEVFQVVSDTKTPQGILAVVKQYQYSLEALFSKGNVPHLIILEQLQDPGNLGTIIRAGEGAGVTGIIMDTSTADIYNPKVVRATMGSVFRIPFLYVEDLSSTLKEIKSRQIRLYAAHLQGKKTYDRECYHTGTGFLIGNESSGLKDETVKMADGLVKIPMLGEVESLNAAIAASILMFEVAKQRRGE